MTQAATSKSGQGIGIYYCATPDADKKIALLEIDEVMAGRFESGAAARAKAAELTNDASLTWETRV